MRLLQLFTILLCVMTSLWTSTRLRADEPITLRVLTYNIHHGEGTDGKFDLERIGKLISELKPDLVALQEVDVKTGRSSKVDQLQEIQRHSGMEHGTFFEAMPFDGGSYGEGILSRWPIISQERIALPSFNNGEPRVVGRVDVAVGLSDDETQQANLTQQANFTFLATHLDHRRDEQERIASAEHINKVANSDESGLPLILAGDLNARPNGKPIQILRESWTIAKQGEEFAPTFPSREPRQTIDYVMYCGPGNWKLIELRVIEEPVASDHCPVLAVMEWSPQ